MGRVVTLSSASVLSVLVLGASAHAGIMKASQFVGPDGIEPLFLADGSWDQGSSDWRDGGDYGVLPTATGLWINEAWAGGPGLIADLETQLDVSTNEDSIVFPISIEKMVANMSDTTWSAFQIEITSTTGQILNVQGLPSVQFPLVSVSGDGNRQVLSFSATPGGTGVPGGSDVVFNFSFNYVGNIFEGINFRILQTAIPTPGALAVFAAAGMAAARRRR